MTISAVTVANLRNITYAAIAVRRQVKAFMTATGVVTVIVLTQVNTASILVFTFVVVYKFSKIQPYTY